MEYSNRDDYLIGHDRPPADAYRDAAESPEKRDGAERRQTIDYLIGFDGPNVERGFIPRP